MKPRQCAAAALGSLGGVVALGALLLALLFFLHGPALLPSRRPRSGSLHAGPDEEAELPDCPVPSTSGCPAPPLLDVAASALLPSEADVARAGHLLGIRPLRYDLDVRVLGKAHFSSAVAMVLKVEKTTAVVAFHLDTSVLRLDLRKLRLTALCQEKEFCIQRVENYTDGQAVIVHLAEPLTKGTVFRLLVPAAEGSVGRMGGRGSLGLYLANEMLPSWALGTIFQMRHARSVFAVLDHPALKAKFSLTLRHPLNSSAASTMPPDEEAQRDGDELRTTFPKTPRIPSYVFTLSVLSEMRRFGRVTDGGTELEVIAPSEVAASSVSWMLDEAARTLGMMSNLSGRAYPLPKLAFLNVLRAPFWGIENAGLVTLDWSWTEYPEYDQSHAILVHEIVHQWLGNLATVSHWDEICLQEGLTAYLTSFIGEQLGLVQETLDIKMSDSRLKALAGDKGGTSIIQPFEDTQQIATRCFLPLLGFSMLGDVFGQDVVVAKFLRLLVGRFAEAAAGLDDWVALFSEAAGDEDAGRLLREFFTEPGYPVLSASRPSPERIQVTGRRLVDDAVVDGTAFLLPLSLATKGGPGSAGSALMDAPDVSLYLDAEEEGSPWYILGPEGRTYARFLYDAPNYKALLRCFGSEFAVRPSHKCPLTNDQIHSVFSDFCFGLMRDEFPLAKEEKPIWADIFRSLRNLTDASKRGQSRLRLDNCCLKLRSAVESSGVGSAFRPSSCSLRSWERQCEPLTLLKFLEA